MANQIYIFKQLLPNQDNGVHYYIDFPTSFIARFSGNVFLNFDSDNYRINANILKIAYDKTINYKDATYVVDLDPLNEFEARFYFIKSYVIQSDMVIFTLELDLWQTYIKDAIFKYAVITKSNKDVGTGVYLPIEFSNSNLDFIYPVVEESSESVFPHVGEMEDKYIDIVFLLQYNVMQDHKYNEEYITRTNLFSINLRTLKETLVKQKEELDDYSSIDLAIDYVGLIFGVSGDFFTNDAQVIKAWIMDNRRLNFKAYANVETGVDVKSYSSYIGVNEITMQAKRVFADYKVLYVEFESDINKNYVLGAFNNGLELIRFTSEKLTAQYYFITNDDSIQVIVQQGNNQQDITKSFEVALTTNGVTETGFRKIANDFSKLVNVGEKLYKSFDKGGVGGASYELLKTAMSANTKPSFENVIGDGDALLTFRKEQYAVASKGLLKSPYVLTATTSIYNELNRNLQYGANFNEVKRNFNMNEVLDAQYLTHPSYNVMYPTFIAVETNVDGIPLDAKNVIEQKLRNGIFVER